MPEYASGGRVAVIGASGDQHVPGARVVFKPKDPGVPPSFIVPNRLVELFVPTRIGRHHRLARKLGPLHQVGRGGRADGLHVSPVFATGAGVEHPPESVVVANHRAGPGSPRVEGW